MMDAITWFFVAMGVGLIIWQIVDTKDDDYWG